MNPRMTTDKHGYCHGPTPGTGLRRLAGGAVVVTALAGGCLTARPSQVLPTSGTIQKDCETRPEIVLVPAGTFTMGIPEAERLCEGKADSFYLETDKYARPQTKIAIAHAFWMGRYPVTRGQYAQFVAETGYAGGGNEWKDPGFPQDDTHPVVNVSALDAEAYAAWLSKKTGSVYRLPSDAEWEYAARAGTVTARYCGDGFADALRYAWVNRQGTASVISQRLPNAFQLSDMLGNVWQWTSDCWRYRYDSHSSDSAPLKTGDCGSRVTRGGGFGSGSGYIRAGARSYFDRSNHDGDIGFRLARIVSVSNP